MKLTPLLRFGEEFGKIDDKVRGIAIYRLSPFEQRAFAGAIKTGLPNCAKRLGRVVTTVLPFFVAAYFVYSEVEAEYHRRCRKNPDDYKNDK